MKLRSFLSIVGVKAYTLLGMDVICSKQLNTNIYERRFEIGFNFVKRKI